MRQRVAAFCAAVCFVLFLGGGLLASEAQAQTELAKFKQECEEDGGTYNPPSGPRGYSTCTYEHCETRMVGVTLRPGSIIGRPKYRQECKLYIWYGPEHRAYLG